MDLILFFAFLGIVAAVLGFGGKRLANELKGLDLKSISGALIALVVVARFLVYLAMAVPIAFINALLRSTPESQNAWISAPFKVQFTDVNFSVIPNNPDFFNAIKISDLSGQIQLANPDSTFAAIILIVIIGIIVLLHFILLNAQIVLRSLHDKTPFEVDNSTRVKKVAVLCFAVWLVYVASVFLLSNYIESQITMEGIELTTPRVRFIGPLFLCGLIFVFSEVFRIGFELKEENELTV